MKRFSALLAALALLCALCACGSSKTDKDPVSGSHSQTETPDTREDDALTGSDSNAPAQPDDDAAEPDGGVSLDQMLRNGLVHDRDGDLTDGKTHITPDLR